MGLKEKFWAFFVKAYMDGLRFVSDKSASSRGSIYAIIGISVALIVASQLLPTALVGISNETAYSGASTTVITMVTVVVPLLAVIGIALRLLGKV